MRCPKGLRSVEQRREEGAVLEVRNLVTRANLVPRVFSLSNIGKREDPGDEVGHAQKRRALGWEIENMVDDFES